MIVAAPVRERLDGRHGVVTGANRHAAYAEVDGFVVVLTARSAPLLPNEIALAAEPPAPGTRVAFGFEGEHRHPSSVAFGFEGEHRHASSGSFGFARVCRHPADVSVGFEGVEVWDPTLRLDGETERRAVDVMRAPGAPPVPADLVHAVATRDPQLARRAAERLVGRGPGLTPEGDDFVAGAAVVVAAGGWPERDAWLRALLPPDLRRRTTALSATLLELAVAGHALEPLQRLLDPGNERWAAALERLVRLGHSTGRAYAAGASAVLVATDEFSSAAVS